MKHLLNSLVLSTSLAISPIALAEEESAFSFDAILDMAAENWDSLVDGAKNMLTGGEEAAAEGAEETSNLSKDAINFAAEKIKENKEGIINFAKQNKEEIKQIAEDNKEEIAALAKQAMADGEAQSEEQQAKLEEKKNEAKEKLNNFLNN